VIDLLNQTVLIFFWKILNIFIDIM